MFQSLDHGLQGRINHDRRMAKLIQFGALSLIRGAPKKIAAVKCHGEVGILEQVSGENQDHSLLWLYEARLQQFFQAGEGFGFGLNDFEFAHLLTSAARGLKNLDSFFPRRWVADADRRGPSFGLHADQTFAATFSQSANQSVGPLGLNNGQLRQMRD